MNHLEKEDNFKNPETNALKYFFNQPHKLGHLLGFKKLNAGHDEWIKYFLNIPRGGRRVLQAHRNSYKTTSGLVAMAMLSLLYPNLRVFIVRKVLSNAEALIAALVKIFNSEIMKLMCQKIYGIPSFETSKWSKTGILLATKKSISPEHSFEPCGIGTSQTGRHYDYIWCDDIITVEDRRSAAERQLTKDYVRELNNIVTPTGSRMYTGTPWHEDDAFSILPEPLKFPIGSIHIEEMDEKWIAKEKENTTTALWNINYELKHVDDSDRIGEFQLCEKFTTPYRVAWIDSSFSNRQKSDRTACAVVAFSPNDEDEWEIQFIGKSWTRSITDDNTMIELLKFLDEYQPIETCLESQLAESTSVFIDQLRRCEETLELSVKNHFTYLHQTKNKHEKIQYYIVGNKRRIKALSACEPSFLKEVASYSKGVEHDDEADALADGIWLWQHSKPLQSYIREYERYQRATM